MAHPLETVPNWVPNRINPRILFVTENYPNDVNAVNGNTYFYRALNQNFISNRANNLLDNLTRTLGVTGYNELEKLNNFMYHHNYFLIDTFPSGQRMNPQFIEDTLNNLVWIDRIIDDIVIINPQQIVFTCVGSNGRLFPILQQRATVRRIAIFDRIVIPSSPFGREIFNSPSNRAYRVFNEQIYEALIQGDLIP